MAVPPTRDCIGEEVEKHCGRCGRKAGANKVGKALCLRGVRNSGLKQAWGMALDMMRTEVVKLIELDAEGFEAFPDVVSV